MGIAPIFDSPTSETDAPTGMIDKQIGEVYHNVQLVAESITDVNAVAADLPGVVQVADNLAAILDVVPQSQAARDAAIAAETAAQTAQTGAETAQAGAVTARTAAETAETNAETAETGAVTARAGAEQALADLLAQKGIANGVCPLDNNTKIAATFLPSFVDDVIEVADFASLPGVGESSKIYVTLNNGFEYRWGGSVYVRIVSSPGTTDELTEGAANLYFSNARVLGTIATGLVDTAGTPAPADTILTVLGKIKRALFTDLPTSLGFKADLAALAANTGASLIGFIQSGTGAVARTLQAKLRDTVSVKDFGAVGDGATNDTAAVQAALNSGAVKVRFPKGTYLLTSVTIPTGTKVSGDGYGSVIVVADNVSNVFVVGGIETSIENLHFTASAQRTGGRYIVVQAGAAYIGSCKFSLGSRCIDISTAGTSIITIDQCNFSQNNNNGADDLILIDTTGADISITECVFDNDPALMPRSGIRVLQVADLTITGCNIIHCGHDLRVDPQAGKVVASLNVANTFLDTANKGLWMKPAAGGSVVRTHFHNVWASSHTGPGMDIDGSLGTIDGLYLVDPQVNLNGGDGISLTGGQNVHILGGQASQNVGSGFSAGPTSTKFTVRNFVSGATDGLTGNAFGIYINAGASNYEVDDNFLSGNTSGEIVGATPTIASAATITAPAAGRAFAISGTTGISAINGGRDGREIVLEFAAALTVTHGTGTASSIRLSGSANFAAVAGSRLRLRHNGTQWFEVGRSV